MSEMMMKINNECSFIHEKAEGIRCGVLRRDHATLIKSHSFTEREIAKHPFEPLPNDSITCRVCEQRPSHPAHANAPTPAPDSEGEWRIHNNKREIVDEYGFYVAFVTDGTTATQIVADHNVVKLLVEALEDLVRQLPTDEQLADFNLDLAETALDAARQRG